MTQTRRKICGAAFPMSARVECRCRLEPGHDMDIDHQCGVCSYRWNDQEENEDE